VKSILMVTKSTVQCWQLAKLRPNASSTAGPI
jgi:hypothetical protein